MVNDQCSALRPSSIRLLVNRMSAEYHRVPPTPDNVANEGEANNVEPVEEQRPGINERMVCAPCDSDERDGVPDGSELY